MDNPVPETVVYHTNAAMDGVTVSWPVPDDPDWSGYEVILMDENNHRYTWDASGLSQGEDRWEAVVNQGLEPGIYSLYIRATAVDGKVSAFEYLEKDLVIGLPNRLVTAGGIFPDVITLNTNQEVTENGVLYGFRNIGSNNVYDVAWNCCPREQSWAFWNKTPVRMERIAVTPRSSYADTEFQVYASDEPFTYGRHSEGDTPLSYTLEGRTRVFLPEGKSYFLIEGHLGMFLDRVGLEYYY